MNGTTQSNDTHSPVSQLYLRHVAMLHVLLTMLIAGCTRPSSGPTGSGSHAPSGSGTISTVPPSDTIATNAIRRTVGIREIKPTWVFYISEFSTDKWKEAGPSSGLCKIVHRNETGKIDWEEDYFDGPRTFIDANGVTIRETLTIHYDYPSGKFAANYFGKDPVILGLTSRLHSSSIGDIGANNAETLDIADKILAGWKKKRL